MPASGKNARMVRLTVLMISIGLADSINPTTIAPALYMASGERPRTRVAEFTLSVFVVYLAGGALIALGPGQLIRHAIPDLDVKHTVRYIAEIIAGVLLLGGAALIWRRRHRMVDRGLPMASRRRKSSVLLGRHDHGRRAPDRVPVLRGDRGDSRIRPRHRARALPARRVQLLLHPASARDPAHAAAGA